MLAGTSILGAMHLRRGRSLRDSMPSVNNTPYHALVLGSGGLLGAAWMGSTLVGLEKSGFWSPSEDDLRVGTSAGSLLVTLLGQGYSPEELTELLTDGEIIAKFGHSVFSGENSDKKIPLSPSDLGYLLRTVANLRTPHLGVLVSSLFVEGKEETIEIENLVNNLTKSKWSKVPTWIVAAELKSGRRKVFSANSLETPGRAVAASCAVPALFKPVNIRGNRYIDGGTISCSNLDLAIQSGAKKITVLSPISGYTGLNYKAGVNRVLNQIVRNTEQIGLDKMRRGANSDVNIRFVTPGPGASQILGKYSLMDSTRMDELLSVVAKEEPVRDGSW